MNCGKFKTNNKNDSTKDYTTKPSKSKLENGKICWNNCLSEKVGHELVSAHLLRVPRDDLVNVLFARRKRPIEAGLIVAHRAVGVQRRLAHELRQQRRGHNGAVEQRTKERYLVLAEGERGKETGKEEEETKHRRKDNPEKQGHESNESRVQLIDPSMEY